MSIYVALNILIVYLDFTERESTQSQPTKTMTTTEPKRMIRIKTGREYEVISFPYLPEGKVRVQVINPKTNKPWHSHSFLNKSEFEPIK